MSRCAWHSAGGSQIELSSRGQCLFLRVATFLAPLSREKSPRRVRAQRAQGRRDEPGKSSRFDCNRLTRRSPRLASFAIVATDSEFTQDRFAKNRRLAGSAFSTRAERTSLDLSGRSRVQWVVGVPAHFVAAVKTRRNESPPKSEHLKRKPSRIAPPRSAAIAAPGASGIVKPTRLLFPRALVVTVKSLFDFVRLVSTTRSQKGERPYERRRSVL